MLGGPTNTFMSLSSPNTSIYQLNFLRKILKWKVFMSNKIKIILTSNIFHIYFKAIGLDTETSLKTNEASCRFDGNLHPCINFSI